MLRGLFEGLPTAKIWVRTRAMNSKIHHDNDLLPRPEPRRPRRPKPSGQTLVERTRVRRIEYL